ncbi:hypothetical protein Tco_0947069 [Tanacetum coccineum]
MSIRDQVLADFISERPYEEGLPIEAPAEKVPRSENKKADALSKIASTAFAHLTKQVLVEILKRKLIEEREILVVVEEEGYCWMTPLIEYLAKESRSYNHGCSATVQSRQNTRSRKSMRDRVACTPAQGPFPEAQGKIQAGRRNHIRQRKAVQGQPIQRLVRKAQHQAKVEEVPHVLWVHCTMIKTSKGDTSFSLTYNTEAVIPVEIGMPSLRCAEINQADNDEGLLLNLDILEERREKGAVREAKSKAKMEKYYNAKVRNTAFRPRDFVYRINEANHAK